MQASTAKASFWNGHGDRGDDVDDTFNCGSVSVVSVEDDESHNKHEATAWHDGRGGPILERRDDPGTWPHTSVCPCE